MRGAAAGVLFPFIVLPAGQQGNRYVLIAYNRDIGVAIYDEAHLRQLGDAVASFLNIKKSLMKLKIYESCQRARSPEFSTIIANRLMNTSINTCNPA